MEVLYPHLFPEGAAEQYLRVVNKPSICTHSLASIDEYFLSCLDPRGRLTFGQLLEWISHSYGRPAPEVLADSLKRLQKRQIRREREISSHLK